MNRASPRVLLRQLTVIALAMMAVVCAGLLCCGVLGVVTPVEVAAAVSASDSRWAPAPQLSSAEWQNDLGGSDVECDALEADLDDDDRDDDDFGDERPTSLAHDQRVALRRVGFPPRPAHTVVGEHQLDPSSWVAGTRLPRGPPTV